MIRSALILALLVPLAASYRPQYVHVGPVFPTGTVLNPCLISAWPMNEGSGVTLNDTSSGGTNTATVNNIANITWGSHPGFPGSSIGWSSSGQATATSTTLTNFTGTTPFSVSVWSSPTASALEVYATDMFDIAGTGQGWLFAHNLYSAGVDVILLKVANNSSTNVIHVRGNTDFTSGTNFLVATYDGSQTAAGVKLYVNGSLETNTIISNTLSATAASGRAPTFNRDGNGGFGSAQNMGYVEIYNCVITAGFISSSFASGPGIY